MYLLFLLESYIWVRMQKTFEAVEQLELLFCSFGLHMHKG